MAEERQRAAGRQEERPADAAPAAPAPAAKKKRKLGKISMLFILLLLAFGVGTGLHFSGVWDARPLVWETVPQIPYVGDKLADFFRIPEQYTLTVEERRAYELNERQKRLDEIERGLLGRESAVDTASDDIAVRAQRLAELEAVASADSANSQEDEATASEKELIAQRVRDFNSMSPRNAALIAEEMAESLSVKILLGLNNDARTSILARMDPQKAARLVELMATQPTQQ